MRVGLMALPLGLALGFTVGCTMDNPAFGMTETDVGTGDGGAEEDDGGDGPTASAGDDGPTASGSGSGSGPTGGDDGTETGGGDSAGDDNSGSGDGADGGDTDGEPMCPDFPGDFMMTVDVEFEGSPYDGCNGRIDISGPAFQLSENTWEVKACNGGEPCNPDCPGEAVTFIFGAPVGQSSMLPAVPSCAHVIVDFHAPRPDDGRCPFMGNAVWDVYQGYDPVPYFMAGSGGGHEVDIVEPFQVDFFRKESCACESNDPGCCIKPPGMYEIKFAGLDGDPHLKEGEIKEESYGGIPFDAANYVSHVHQTCGELPHIEWALKRWPG